jgi:methyl-accepting chemotaxis protein
MAIWEPMHYIPPAYSVLLDHYNRAVEGLNTALGVVHSNTAAITEAATGIRDGSVDLAQRTEQEAAALERTARDLADVTRESAHGRPKRGQCRITGGKHRHGSSGRAS